jgi:hypothetical protein
MNNPYPVSNNPQTGQYQSAQRGYAQQVYPSITCCELTTPISTMASLEPSSCPLSLLALPTEIHAVILTHLRFLDLHTLRLTNHYLHALIPLPSHAEFLTVETSGFDFLACVGCTRLRPTATFSPKMFKKKKAPGGSQAHNRFCFECGRRPLPGVHRYMLGSRWEEYGVPFARCLRCGSIARGPEDQAVPLCLSCHTQDLERVRAAGELERVRREARGRKERRLLRAERRRKWIDGGRALSDYSSEDTSEQYVREDLWDWGQDDDISYSCAVLLGWQTEELENSALANKDLSV